MRRLARAYGRLVVVLATALFLARLAGPRSELALLAVGVLALSVAGLSVLWIRTELALIQDIRRHRELP